MKNVLITLLLIAGTVAVKAQSSAADSVAQRISRKMKDTLALTEEQRLQLYQVNLQLHADKAGKRQLYAGTDSLQVHIQRVESTRDSLYALVLTQQQYLLYRQKKSSLINNQ